MTRNELKVQILDALRGERLGITKSKLAEKLGASRPTISKYVDALIEEGKAMEISVGAFKLVSLAGREKDGILKTGFRAILKMFMHTIEDMHGGSFDWRKFGRMASKNLRVHEIVETDQLFTIIFHGVDEVDESVAPSGSETGGGNTRLAPARGELMRRLGRVFKDVYQGIMTSIDDCEVHEPVIIENPPIITLRIAGTRLAKSDQVMEIMAGLVEEKMREDFLGLRVKITNSHPPGGNTLDVIVQVTNIDEFSRKIV